MRKIAFNHTSINRSILLFSGLCISSMLSLRGFSQLKFHKQQVAAESSESVNVFDVNNDGKPDIVSGAFWYESPEFITKHLMGHRERTGPTAEYWDDFATIPIDVGPYIFFNEGK